MAEINARALMFNLGREDAIDSTTSAKIARYAERKQLAYKLTDEGVLLLDGRGKKIHLRNGVVTLRNALGLHALPERCRAIGDNRVLNKQQQHTNVVTMLHVRKMALVDPRLLKSLRENPTPLPDAIDTTLRDLDAEMTSILDGSDADESEKVRLYNQALLRYNDMTKARAAKPIPVVVEVKKEAAATTMPTTASVVEPADIVGTLPKTLQMKGRQLLSAVTWNERGELIHKGVAIRGSNAVDLVHYEIEKHPIPSDGSSSPTKCAPPTYPWNWSATSQGDYTCRRNAVNGLRRNVLRRRRCRNGRLYKFPIRSVRPSVVVLSLSWSGGDRNYTDTTTILNVSAVTVALPLYGE